MQDPQKPTSFLDELKRRRVVRAALTYAGAAFVLLEGAQLVLPSLGVDEGIYQTLVWIALAGFPLALLLGWLFDVTPQGIRLTGRAEGDRMVARSGMLLGGAGTLLVAGVGFTVFVNFPRPASAEVPAGADLIAVLPFSTKGDGVGVLEEGMVDLLSRNLDQVGAIRTVDPRTVLARWQRYTEEGVTHQESLLVGQEAGAGSVLTGSVISVAGSVRITAELHTVDGARLAQVAIDGSSADILGLVDALSLALMRELWRSEQPTPRLDVSALTSSDLDAIRAYLEGERHYRASRWDSAMIAFSRAVSEDSLFPLAHYRRAATAGWMGQPEVARQSAEIARRLSDRLPARERSLVRAEELRSKEDRAAAIDTLSAYVERFPDDPEGWFFLADDLYHLRGGEIAPPNQADQSEILWMFEKALALDPGFAPALIHPLEIAFRGGDTAQIARYVAMLDRAASTDDAAVDLYRDALAALAGPHDADAMSDVLARTVAADSGVMDLSRQAARAARGPLQRALALWPAGARDEVIEELREGRGRGSAHALATAEVLTAAGRLREARAIAADPALRAGMPANVREALALYPVYAGWIDRPEPGAVRSPFGRAAVELIRAVDRGDAAALRAAVEGVRGLSEADPRTREALVGAGRGFLQLIEGDTVAGLRNVETALEGTPLGMSAEALWFRWLESSAAHPATRVRVMAVLERPWPGFPTYEVRRQELLARVLEAEGRAEEAAVARDLHRAAIDGADPAVIARR